MLWCILSLVIKFAGLNIGSVCLIYMLLLLLLLLLLSTLIFYIAQDCKEAANELGNSYK